MESKQTNVDQDQIRARNITELNNVEKGNRPYSLAKDSPTLGGQNGRGERFDHKYDNMLQHKAVNRVYEPKTKPREHDKNINLEHQKEIKSKQPTRYKNVYTQRTDDEPLRDSGNSNATYLSVKPDENLSFHPRLPDLPQRRRQPVRRKCGCHRVCVIISTIVAGAVVLGIVAFVVYMTWPKPGKGCPTPDVKNGNATVSGDVLNVQCQVGYSKTNDEPIKCVEGVWSSPALCPLVDCGEPPNNTNGHNVYDNTTFESTARLSCNNGFMLTAPGVFECSADGNWSNSFNASCTAHPCGTYSLPAHSHIDEDFSYVNMTMLLRCDDGFAFTGHSERFLKCENQTWLGNATCEIPGIILFNNKDPVFVTKSERSVTCSVTNSPDWKTVMLTKQYYKLNGSDSVVLAKASNGSGIFEYKTTKDLDSPTINAFPGKDGVSIEMKFESLQCGDNGVYTCGIIVGNVDNPVDVKEVNTTVTVIDRSSTFPIITAPLFAHQGTSMNASCNGTVGLDEKGQKLGNIQLQIKYPGETKFRNISTMLTSSQKEHCQLKEFITTTIQVTNAMDNATLRCITTTADGEELSNSTQQLKVFVTTVSISTSRQPFDIGYPANISCDIENILGWKVIEMRKVCNKLDVVVCRIYENQTTDETHEHIELHNVNITDDFASFELLFNGTKCSDACPEGGPANYTVFIQVDHDWINESITVMFNDPPQRPNITNEPEKFYVGQEATIICAGDAGIPARDVVIKRNGSLVRISKFSSTFDEVECTTNLERKFSFFVSTVNQGDIFVCETLMSNGSSLSSNTINVSITEPVLYFTSESKLGEISKSKQIVCVLSEVSNLTSVSLFRGASISPLCTVDMQNGICTDNNYYISGNYTNNGTRFLTTLSIRKVRCIDEAEFTCQPSSSYTQATKMNFAITRSVKSPVLRLPTTLVVNQTAEWEDELNCTADIGYPSTGTVLRIEIKSKGSNTYTPFSSEQDPKGDTCQKNATITKKQATFDVSKNGSIIRCAIINNTQHIVSSVEKEIRLLHNICLLNTTKYDFNVHEYDCRRFERCDQTRRLYDIACAPRTCATSSDGTDQICSSLQCNNCPAT